MEIYIIQVKSVFLLSLWKTYVGPALSVPYGFSYVEMLLFNVGAAMFSGYVILRFSRHINLLLDKLLQKRDSKPGFKPQLRKYLRFWRRYGFYGVMALTPVLIGIPLGVWISARLGTGKTRIMVTLFVLTVFWASLAYYAALSGVNLVDS
jgi:uncharacterized protein Usg